MDPSGAAADDMLDEFVGFLKPASSNFSNDRNESTDDPFLAVPLVEALAVVIPTLFIMLSTIIGNVMVIAAVFTYRPLKQSPNMYLVSLAVADITVAMFVMPFNVIYSIRGKWDFGLDTCKAWLTFDILCCTASILNLCAIALDRYQAIHDPINYAQKRTLRRVLTGIFLVWLISAIISIPPLLGWNDWPETFTPTTPCMLTSEKGFVVYSSAGSFYIPLIIMSIVYVKIFLATRRRLRARTKAATGTKMSDIRSASNVRNVRTGRNESIDHSDPKEEESEFHPYHHKEQQEKQQQQDVRATHYQKQRHHQKQQSNNKKKGISSSKTAASGYMTVITKLDTSSSSETGTVIQGEAAVPESVTGTSKRPTFGSPAVPTSSTTAATVTSIDHCPSSIVKIAIEKNSSSISSSQDELNLLMPHPDLNPNQMTNDAEDGDEGRNNKNSKGKGRRTRRFQSSSLSKSSSWRDSNGKDDSTTDEAEMIASMDANQSLVQLSGGDCSKFLRTSDRDRDEVTGNAAVLQSIPSPPPAVSDRNIRRLCDQMIESAGFTSTNGGDMEENGMRSGHHKRIIESEFNRDPQEVAVTRKSGCIIEAAAADADAATTTTATTTTSMMAKEGTTMAGGSCVKFVRQNEADHKREERDEKKKEEKDEGERMDGKDGMEGTMLNLMDQNVSKLSVVHPVTGSSSNCAASASRGSPLSLLPTASTSHLSAPSLLIPHHHESEASVPEPASASSATLTGTAAAGAVREKNQSYLGNNLVQQQRHIASFDVKAGGGEGFPSSSSSRSKSQLRVEYESSCGSSMPASTGTGSASVAQVWEEKQRISLSRERKAARVLGIVMGIVSSSSLYS